MSLKSFFKKEKKETTAEVEQEKGVSYTDFLRAIGRSFELKKIDPAEQFKKLFPRTIDDIVAKHITTSDGKVVAMDSSIRKPNVFSNEIPEEMFGFLSTTFIGWQACALLKQNSFIDKACSIPAQDAIAPDYTISYIDQADKEADEADVDVDLLAKIKDDSKRKYKINDICVRQTITKKVFGYSLCIPVVEGADMEQPYNIDGIKEGSYKGMAVVEPFWVTYEFDDDSATNPASPHFYEPTWYRLNGSEKRIHRSWVIKSVNSHVPDVLKPTYFFGGIPLTQQIYERVYAAEKVANEAPLLALTKRMLVIDANIQNMVANPNEVQEIMSALTQLRDNFGVYAKNPGDQVQQIDTSLGDFDALIMTQYQLVASIAEMPATKLLKTTPKGFNATGEYEERDYKQSLVAIEENDYLPIIERHNELYTKSELKKVIRLDAKFNPIDTPTEKEVAEVADIKARTMATFVGSGIVSAQETRDILRSQENSEYSTLPKEMEEPDFDLNFGENEEQTNTEEEPNDKDAGKQDATV